MRRRTRIKECDLFAPLRRWLVRLGFAVYAEVHCLYRIDVVAIRPRWLYPVIIELKTRFTWQLLKQACIAQVLTPCVFAAASTAPSRKTLEKASEEGLGLIRISRTVEVIRWPATRVSPDIRYAEQLRARVADHLEAKDGEAGIPTLPGTGPAQLLAKEVQVYLNEHPRARWKDIFAALPNHYASPNSMAGATRFRVARPSKALEIANG